MRVIVMLKFNSQKDDDEDHHKDRQTYAIVGMFRMNPIQSANISNFVTQRTVLQFTAFPTYILHFILQIQIQIQIQTIQI